jgi:hypothetical protein
LPGPKDTPPDVAVRKTVSENDDLFHKALRSLTILGDDTGLLLKTPFAGHLLKKKQGVAGGAQVEP